MSNKRIPVTVLTGFLGSGKTTLLRHLLVNSGQRLAVVVNEFGSVGLDGDLLKTCGFCSEEETKGRIVELNNGCLCCTVQEDFLPTMQNLLASERSIDGIIIETSGLALPRPLLAALSWPDIRSSVFINGVVTLVDGEALSKGSPIGDLDSFDKQREKDKSIDHENSIDELFTDQLEEADLVLISRADLIAKNSLDAVSVQISKKVRPETPILPIKKGDIDSVLILGLHRKQETKKNEDHEHNHLKVFTGNVKTETSIEKKELESLLVEFVSTYQIIRLKGRFWLKGKAIPLQLQMVGPRISTWYEAAPNEAWNPKGYGGADFVVISLREGASEAITRQLKVSN